MSSVKDFETYARDCVNLAGQPDVPPELREQLLQMAREWMKASMEAEDESEHLTSKQFCLHRSGRGSTPRNFRVGLS
jgi:hypothetical protein